jgi:hypothetical protein
MDDYEAPGIFSSCPAHDLKKMLLMCVYSFVLQQTKEVKTALVSFPISHKILPLLHLKKLSGAQPVVDALEFLDNDPPGPHVEVAYFGRTLIAIRKPDRLTGTIQKGPRIVVFVAVDIRSFGCEHSVAFFFLAISPPVTNY